jgi:hypothetical protein
MGDRAVIAVRDNRGFAPAAIYLHWKGHEALALVDEAAAVMRNDDASYALARLVASIARHDEPSEILGLGLVPAPKATDAADGYRDYSCGDAGVLVVDVTARTVQCYAGYLAASTPYGPKHIERAREI